MNNLQTVDICQKTKLFWLLSVDKMNEYETNVLLNDYRPKDSSHNDCRLYIKTNV